MVQLLDAGLARAFAPIAGIVRSALGSRKNGVRFTSDSQAQYPRTGSGALLATENWGPQNRGQLALFLTPKRQLQKLMSPAPIAGSAIHSWPDVLIWLQKVHSAPVSQPQFLFDPSSWFAGTRPAHRPLKSAT